MKPSFRLLPVLLALALAAGSRLAADAAVPAPAEGDLRTMVELARTDLQLQKTAIIAQNIDFTEPEAAEFWPLHRQYQAAAAKLGDRRVALLRDYITKEGSLTEDEARQLAKQAFDLEHDRTKLKEHWFKQFAKVIPAKKAVRFFQIENQLNAAVDLRLAASLPLIH